MHKNASIDTSKLEIVSLGEVARLRGKAMQARSFLVSLGTGSAIPDLSAKLPRSLRSRAIGVIKLYALKSDLDLHAVERCDGLRKNLFCGFLGKHSVRKRGVKAGVKMDEMEQFGARFNSDPRRGLGV